MKSLLEMCTSPRLSLVEFVLYNESKSELDWNLLKELYKIYSPSKHEYDMLKFIENYLKKY